MVFFNVFFSRLLARKSFQSFFSLVSSLRSQRTVQALLENELASCIPSDYRYSLGLAYRQRDSPLGFGNYLNLPRASWSVLLPQRTEINCVTDELLLLRERERAFTCTTCNTCYRSNRTCFPYLIFLINAHYSTFFGTTFRYSTLTFGDSIFVEW